MSERIRITEIKELVSMLDNDKNAMEGIDVSKLCVNSSKEIYWKCENGHTFKEKVNLIYTRKHKCYYCSGREVWAGENDLQTLYPEIAAEFDVVKNGKTPDSISPRDTTVYWWTCKNKHPSFAQSVEHRVNRKTICPYCSGRKAASGVNDLETLFPEIAQEWDVEKNDGLLPKDVPPFTHKSYYWICPKGHSYKKKVIQRTKYHKPIDCPNCTKAHSTSFPEQAIYYYVKKCFPNAINRYKEPFEKGMELDIYIPQYKMGIEYDGAAFHNDKKHHEREYRKYLACKRLGIRLIRIKETEDTWGDTADKIIYVNKRINDKDFSAFLINMFSILFAFNMYTFTNGNNKERLLNLYYGFPTDFNVARDRPEILEYLVNVEHSFGVLYPELAKMWCNEANGNLTPFMFTPGSNYPATWVCPKCGSTWKSPISSIVSRKVKSCKKCSMRENGKTLTKIKTAKHGSLAENSEVLLRQWDYEENGNLSPYEIPLNYTFKVAWKCDKCGYKWSSSPNSRVRKDQIFGCPHCTGREAMPGVDDLQSLRPDIAKEWDYYKNEDVLPSHIRPYSNKKYFWICPICGYSYSACPGARVNGHGCPKCARIRVGKKNAKEVGQYDKEGALINTYYGVCEAARVMQVVPNAIYQAIKTGGKSKGFYWRYIIN